MQFDWRRLRFVPIVVLGFLAVVTVDYAIRGPKAKQRQGTIERALRSIPDPESSSLTNATSGFKTSSGYATRVLQTDLAPSEIKSYYRAKLEEQGWFYYQENLILSSRRQVFCKGTGEATVLAIPESVIKKPYEYSLTMSWNNTEGCN